MLEPLSIVEFFPRPAPRFTPLGKIRFRPMEVTPQKEEALWARIEKLSRRILSDQYPGRESFTSSLSNPDNLYFDVVEEEGEEVGFICFVRHNSHSAEVHGLFWDLRLRGRERQVDRLARWVMKEYGKVVVRAFVQERLAATVAFMRRMGWSEDGRIRKAYSREGEFFDIILFTRGLEDEVTDVSASPGE